MTIDTRVVRRLALGVGLPVAFIVALTAVLTDDAQAPDIAEVEDRVGAREIVVDVVGEGDVEVMPDREYYDDGATVTLDAQPAEGWEFVGWSGGYWGTENPAQFEILAGRQVIASFSPIPNDRDGPTIELWEGETVTAGERGQAQRWFNILGNVEVPDDATVVSLSYTLNGGRPQRLNVGPDGRRLVGDGDFNIEIPYADLEPGANHVRIYSITHKGKERVVDLSITKDMNTPKLPYEIDWSDVDKISDAAYVVDGRWDVDDGIRPTVVGYDRTVGIGDVSWSDYELTVPITLGEVGEGAGTGVSGEALVGAAVHWPGHGEQEPGEQPRIGAFEFGAFATYNLKEDGGRFQLQSTGRQQTEIGGEGWQEGETYIFKVRAEASDGGVEYSFKYWRDGDFEPVDYQLTFEHSEGPRAGAVLLVAHHVNAVFGDVTVSQL